MTLKDDILKRKDGLKTWQQERVIFETTNLMCELMDAEGVSRAALATRLGTSRSFVTQILDGTTNMTLRTVSDVFTALGHEFHPKSSPIITVRGHAESVPEKQSSRSSGERHVISLALNGATSAVVNSSLPTLPKIA